MTPNRIENIMLVPNYKTAYFIGCIGNGKITIHSQQIRAFNLAYALIRNEKLTPKKRVAIIGGGISGITFASAISQKCKCKIDIYETHQEVLDLQRKSDRYVHPNIFDWPLDEANNKNTDIPLLNWEATEVKFIVKKFDVIWENVKSLNSKIQIHTQVVVKNVEEIEDGNLIFSRLTYTSAQKKEKKIDKTSPYDYVIYAGGFGLEKHERVKRVSYWKKDDYEDNIERIDKKFKIYGTGDGGLIDCIRISLLKFDYEDLVKQFSKKAKFNKLGNDIKKREEKVKQTFENSNQELSRQKINDEISKELKEIYTKAFKPEFEELSSILLSKYAKRETVQVTLFGKTQEPYTLESSLLNRLIVFFLIQNGIVKYEPLDDRNSKTIGCIRLFLSRVYNWITNTVVIERLGPERPYMSLFKIKEKEIDTYKSERLLLGIEKHWQSNFFDNN